MAIFDFLSPKTTQDLSTWQSERDDHTPFSVTINPDSFPRPPKATYVPCNPYSQNITNSNSRTAARSAMRSSRSKENGALNGKALRKYAEETLGEGSLRKVVRLPEGEDENEWLAVNSKVRRAWSCNLCSYDCSGRFLQPYQPSLWIYH